MDFLAVLLLSLAVSPVSSLPNQQPTIIEGNGRKTIAEINRDLNLMDGDIKQNNKGIQKSAILGDEYRWTGNYIPYVLNETLSMNDKGVILRAFEQMRLKSCIDFVPRTTEADYVSVESQEGCWSDIGKRGGMQPLSIGEGCAYLSAVQHEFLHCLGFFHEQNRYDRDDYVEIVFENIIPDKLSNFDKESEQMSTTQGTPYDYTSVMHYGQDDFTNGNGHTLITKVPRFQNVIGQVYDLSPWDSYELSKLYNCNESISYLDRCSFDNYFSRCGMATCSSMPWTVTSYVYTGPYNDHSGLPSLGVPAVSMDNSSSVPGYFMNFNTMYGWEGMSGVLESKVMTPKRGCNVQCLEFFYYHSGNETDQLNIWIREYHSIYDTIGTLRLMDQITGPPTDHWQYRLVPLDANKTFQVGFEARKGGGYSRGGFSVDDINLSESGCPHNIWQINNFMETWNKSGSYQLSPLYYSPEGYRYQVWLSMNQNSFGLFVRLVSGVYDDRLQWPCPWRQVTFTLLDQNPDIRNRASQQRSLTTDPTELYAGKPVWGRPSEVGSQEVTNGEKVYVNTAFGYSNVMDKAHIGDREFVKGGDLIILISMQDISSLQQKDTLPCPSVPVKNFSVSLGAQIEPCVERRRVPTSTPATNTTTPPDTFTPSECLDFFCSSANIVPPSVALLLALILMAVN